MTLCGDVILSVTGAKKIKSPKKNFSTRETSDSILTTKYNSFKRKKHAQGTDVLSAPTLC